MFDVLLVHFRMPRTSEAKAIIYAQMCWDLRQTKQTLTNYASDNMVHILWRRT